MNNKGRIEGEKEGREGEACKRRGERERGRGSYLKYG